METHSYWPMFSLITKVIGLLLTEGNESREIECVILSVTHFGAAFLYI